jgi:hypothetical protein
MCCGTNLLNSDIVQSDIRLSPLSFFAEIRLSAHLYWAQSAPATLAFVAALLTRYWRVNKLKKKKSEGEKSNLLFIAQSAYNVNPVTLLNQERYIGNTNEADIC